MVDDPASAAKFAAQFAALREQFLQRLEATLLTLGAQLGGEAAQLPAGTLQDVQAQLHRLAGTGGTFGFVELSQQARQLELQAEGWCKAGAPIAGAEWDAWRTAVLGLGEIARQGDAAHGGMPGRS